MQFKTCAIEGLVVIEHKAWPDSRGYFSETYNQDEFSRNGISANFVQDNMSYSHQGVLRGLHAQAGTNQQGKLVKVVQGRVWDVAVDVRKDSPTFGQYHALELNDTNQLSFWIPPGFLHGFLALTDNTIFTYKVTGKYDPSGEFGVKWDDPQINIQWPVSEISNLTISDKDLSLPFLKDIDTRF